MKEKFKKAGMTALILAAVCFYGHPLLVAFVGQVFSIPLHQSVDEIQSVNLLDSSKTDHRVLMTVEGEEIDGFMDQFLDMKAGQYVNDPPTELGPLTVAICYEDGAIDYIGSDICQYVTASGEEKSRGWYYIGRETMKQFFLKYVDTGRLPDLYE